MSLAAWGWDDRPPEARHVLVNNTPTVETCLDCRGTGANAEAPGDCPTCAGWGTVTR